MNMPDYRPSPQCLHRRRADVQEKSDEHAKASIVGLACRPERRKTHIKTKIFRDPSSGHVFLFCNVNFKVAIGSNRISRRPDPWSRDSRYLAPSTPLNLKAFRRKSSWEELRQKYCKPESAEKTLSIVLIGSFALGAMPAKGTGQCDRSQGCKG
jgi:hypothetical protein